MKKPESRWIYMSLGTVTFAGLGLIAVLAQTKAIPRPTKAADQRNFEDLEPEFTFVRAVYTGLGPYGYYKGWYTDWPKADRQFIMGIQRLTNIRVAEQGKTIPLTDPEIFHYPFIYAVEVGHMDLTEEEVISLREYLQRGGFLFCDDFWGSGEWDNFQRMLGRVLPGSSIVDIPQTHELFRCYYDIPQILQVPNVGNAVYNRVTYEQDGFVPH